MKIATCGSSKLSMPAVPMPRTVNDDALWNKPTCCSWTEGASLLRSSRLTANLRSIATLENAVTGIGTSCTDSERFCADEMTVSMPPRCENRLLPLAPPPVTATRPPVLTRALPLVLLPPTMPVNEMVAPVASGADVMMK